MENTHIAELLVPFLLKAFKNRHPRSRLRITGETSPHAVERVAQWLREKLPNFTPDPWNGDPLAQTQYVCDAFERLIRPPFAELAYLLGFTDTPTIGKAHQCRLPLSGTAGYIDAPGCAVYQSVRELCATPKFHHIDESPYPSAELRMNREFGTAQLRPLESDREALLSHEKQAALVEKMWSQCRQLSDLDADVLDFAYSEWLSQAETADDSAVLDLNKFLEIRGIRKKSKGRASGRKAYTSEQRAEIAQCLDRIESIWMQITWQYGKWNEETMPSKMWGKYWLQATIVIEPPEAITDRYADIERHAPKRNPGREELALSARVKEQRLKLCLSRLRLAEVIDIPPAQLVRVELGRPAASECRDKIKKWLATAG